jgi:cell wall-associated NlpC family hydrolase
MRPGQIIGVMGVLLIALLGCATNPKLPDFPLFSHDQEKVATPAQKGVIQTALSLLGTPYRFGGTTPQGFDCTGFINYVYRHSVGIVLPRESHSLIRAGKSVSAIDLQPADLVYFKIEHQKPLHAGIYIGNGKFIHAPSSKGRVNIQSLGMDYWRTRFIAARRVI